MTETGCRLRRESREFSFSAPSKANFWIAGKIGEEAFQANFAFLLVKPYDSQKTGPGDGAGHMGLTHFIHCNKAKTSRAIVLDHALTCAQRTLDS
jgi:hypothetical protein